MQLAGLTAPAVLEAEQRLALALSGDVAAISPLRCLHLYLELLGISHVVRPCLALLWGVCEGGVCACAFVGGGGGGGRGRRPGPAAPDLLVQPAPPDAPAPPPTHTHNKPPPQPPQSLRKCELLQLVAVSAAELATKASLSPALAAFPPSLTAASCLAKAHAGIGLHPAWPTSLQAMTGYAPDQQAFVSACDLLSLLGLAA